MELKEIIIAVVAVSGMVTGMLALLVSSGNLLYVVKDFLVNHPSHKGIIERELQVYDELNKFDAAISPLLTKTQTEVEVDRADVADVRDRLKTLATNVFCPERLRTELFGLVAHLKPFAAAETDRVRIPTAATRQVWQASKDVARRRVRQFVSYDEPHLLFRESSAGPEFVAAFRARWQRERFIARHPDTTFTFWEDGEKPPLLRRLLT